MYPYIYNDYLIFYNCTTQTFISISNDIMDCEKQTDLNKKGGLNQIKKNHDICLNHDFYQPCSLVGQTF